MPRHLHIRTVLAGAVLAELSHNIEALAIPDSAERIVNEIEKQLPQSK